METIDFPLEREHVELHQLLKLVGICDSGGAGKQMVARGEVQVDGEVESRKARKLRGGEHVRVGATTIRIVAAR